MSRTQIPKRRETAADLASRTGDYQCAVATVVEHLYAGMERSRSRRRQRGWLPQRDRARAGPTSRRGLPAE